MQIRRFSELQNGQTFISLVVGEKAPPGVPELTQPCGEYVVMEKLAADAVRLCATGRLLTRLAWRDLPVIRVRM